ncbi:diaminohydroxyphosphoribosylaminopyrimidine deaminase [Mariprofundus aestuarium]|uniref:Riboflavin biosynthesis protein RibD n=1 Tax=Mariprofundus aestuarium TaxID=1921086 RepID=A0A2K8KYI1_MARES|nr:bifunctional diaminohydroxyphosphoribosylaminopyrimidine deaminase/5-amino-6-(5-phosphoribosylamino)uracil reductase RibD [Mariprofundus aestuarium]ATX80070.1 diaminohydroxyphosphoribosylaminopyrimidine deaminase [Mariprofundus aestuarium]
MLTEPERKHHEPFMQRAIELAKRGIGSTHPNPRVGAVVVGKSGEVVGEGWHAYPGGLHAEAMAIEKAGENAQGATLYVTLEPCAAHGRTPACTDAIRSSGITDVIYASSDPNPKMAGGAKVLVAARINVIGGFMKDEADKLNLPFFHYMKTGRPYVTAKAAISLDGKLATHSQHSQWISGPESRLHAQAIRAQVDAIVVGAGTLHFDNPSLTVRDVEVKGSVPLRVVLCFETPHFSQESKLLSDDAPTRFYVRSFNEHTEKWREAGVQIEKLNSLDAILKHLAQDGYLHLLLEGGGCLHASFFDAHFTSEVVLYQAPILIGGRDAVSLWNGTGVETLDHALRLADIKYRKLGNDVMIRGNVIYPD